MPTQTLYTTLQLETNTPEAEKLPTCDQRLAWEVFKQSTLTLERAESIKQQHEVL